MANGEFLEKQTVNASGFRTIESQETSINQRLPIHSLKQ